MTPFSFDNNLSPHFARMLQALDVDVRALRDEFPQDTDDTVWLPEIGRRGWVLVTYDRGITTRPAEARALKDNSVTALILGRFWRTLRRWDQAVWLITNWPRIEAFVAQHPRGTVAELPHRGRPRYVVL